MSEEAVAYLLKPEANGDTINAEADTLRQQLRTVKRQLIGLLTTVERVLGDEPSVQTRAERRRQ